MAGLYIHIPFCRRQCYYCDFHFTVSFRNKERVFKALLKEIEQRKNEVSNNIYNTIYFGGGTPSVLTIDELKELFFVIYTNYNINDLAEITLESNPDDLNQEYLELLKKYTPINRLSIGVQSFIDRDLQWMNRRHSSEDAAKCITRANSVGFRNLNVDLIYGIPAMLNDEWKRNLEMVNELFIPHLSAYHLTIEPKTVFAYYRKKGRLEIISEERSIEQFETLIEFAKQTGYEHYEISNFAKPGAFSQHNMGYWTQKSYLGFGPSAHSYDGKKRRWNVSNNTIYAESVEKDTSDYYHWESIDTSTAYNEYIMTSLRTMWGINLKYLEKCFGTDYSKYCLNEADQFIFSGKLIRGKENIFLSDKGKMVVDYVISALMMT